MNGHGIGFHDGNDFLWMTDLGYVLVQLGLVWECFVTNVTLVRYKGELNPVFQSTHITFHFLSRLAHANLFHLFYRSQFKFVGILLLFATSAPSAPSSNLV